MEIPVTRHTSELKRTQQAAEEVMLDLREKGWEVYHEKVPLIGQAGYYCVRTIRKKDGSAVRHAHSVRWNRFEEPLLATTIDCISQRSLLDFIWQHGTHQHFEYFEYGDGDVGLVCYCNASRGWSIVLRISDEFDHDLNDKCLEILGEIANASGF